MSLINRGVKILTLANPWPNFSSKHFWKRWVKGGQDKYIGSELAAPIVLKFGGLTTESTTTNPPYNNFHHKFTSKSLDFSKTRGLVNMTSYANGGLRKKGVGPRPCVACTCIRSVRSVFVFMCVLCTAVLGTLWLLIWGRIFVSLARFFRCVSLLWLNRILEEERNHLGFHTFPALRWIHRQCFWLSWLHVPAYAMSEKNTIQCVLVSCHQSLRKISGRASLGDRKDSLSSLEGLEKKNPSAFACLSLFTSPSENHECGHLGPSY